RASECRRDACRDGQGRARAARDARRRPRAPRLRRAPQRAARRSKRMNDPYAPPGGYAPPAPPLATGDTSELFLQTLPPPAMRAAGLCAVVTGILMLFMCFRFVLAGVYGPLVPLMEITLVVSGLLEFAVAWGVTGGRLATWILGLALTPVVALLSLVTLLTG